MDKTSSSHTHLNPNTLIMKLPQTASMAALFAPPPLPTCTLSSKVPNDFCPLSVCSVFLPHSLHLNPVSGAGLEEGQSVGGVTVCRLGDNDRAILGGVGHSEGVALGVAG